MGWAEAVEFPAGIYLCHDVQTGPGVYPVSRPMGTRRLLPWQ